MIRRTLSLTALALVVASSAASAQNAQMRDGFTISFGLGGGSAALTCPGCTTNTRENSASGYLRIGGALSPNLVLAGESNGWAKTISNVDTQMGSLMGVVLYYPSATSGFFFEGGAGFGSYTEKNNVDRVEVVAPAYQAGLGYDLRVGKNFSLTPYATFVGMSNGDEKLNGVTLNQKIGTNQVQYGLGFTWH